MPISITAVEKRGKRIIDDRKNGAWAIALYALVILIVYGLFVSFKDPTTYLLPISLVVFGVGKYEGTKQTVDDVLYFLRQQEPE